VGEAEAAGLSKEGSETSETRSEDSPGPAADSSTASNPDSEDSKHEADFRPSPKRKQSHPQYSPQVGQEVKAEPGQRETQISSNIEFNNQTHGYDCRQCDYSTHEHATMREHVVTDHLRDKADLQCKECMVTFTKPFNLKIHIRKHETSSQFLPCEYCEQVFKVPNKLIKHMEGVHSVCPTCGEKNSDKTGLQEHMEKIHGEPKKGVQSNLQQLSSLTTSLFPGKARPADMDNRHAKMRKLDSLAEHIRAKQLQAATGTNVINGNEAKVGPLPEPLERRRKSDLPAVRALLDKRPDHFPFSRPGLESLVSQLNKMNSAAPVIKSENNNILSSLSKMTEFPAGFPRYRPEPEPSRHAADLTPPVSPPHSTPDSFTRLTPHHLTGLNNNPAVADTEHCSQDSETGLDLTVKKERRSDENLVVVAGSTEREPHPEADLYRGRQLLSPSFPYIVPSLPFLSRMPLNPIPHHNSSFTEHLFKLASISRPSSGAGGPQDLSKPVSSLASHPNTVLSAMLGHRQAAAHQSVFPVFPPGLPASMFPQHPLPPAADERDCMSPPHGPAPGLESKPFRCTYCPKEFGHLSSLESHVERLHTNEARHNCEVCGKAFSSKSNLTAHKKIHSGERPFECEICHKRFRQKAHLQKHETTHSNATPYQCPHCDKAFGHPSNLNTHIATHSDVR